MCTTSVTAKQGAEPPCRCPRSVQPDAAAVRRPVADRRAIAALRRANVKCGEKPRLSASNPAATTSSSTAACMACSNSSCPSTPSQITLGRLKVGEATRPAYAQRKTLTSPRDLCQPGGNALGLAAVRLAQKSQRQMNVLHRGPTKAARKASLRQRIAQRRWRSRMASRMGDGSSRAINVRMSEPSLEPSVARQFVVIPGALRLRTQKDDRRHQAERP